MLFIHNIDPLRKRELSIVSQKVIIICYKFTNMCKCCRYLNFKPYKRAVCIHLNFSYVPVFIRIPNSAKFVQDLNPFTLHLSYFSNNNHICYAYIDLLSYSNPWIIHVLHPPHLCLTHIDLLVLSYAY